MRTYFFAIVMAHLGMAQSAECAEPIRERAVSFEVVPKFKVEGAHTDHPYASFDIEGRHLIWPTTAPKFESLQDGQKYRFELIEIRTVIPMGKGVRELWTPELHRVSNGHSVIYDASICHAHRATMKRTEVPILYGLPGGSAAYWSACMDKFPNHGIVYGGCVVKPDRSSAMTWICEDCKAAKLTWKEPAK